MSTNIRDIYEQFRSEVDGFLAESGMSKTAFGKEALKDPGFVDGLNAGRFSRPDTISRVQVFMGEWRKNNNSEQQPRKAG